MPNRIQLTKSLAIKPNATHWINHTIKPVFSVIFLSPSNGDSIISLIAEPVSSLTIPYMATITIYAYNVHCIMATMSNSIPILITMMYEFDC